jgi:hypothetical protein
VIAATVSPMTVSFLRHVTLICVGAIVEYPLYLDCIGHARAGNRQAQLQEILRPSNEAGSHRDAVARAISLNA